MTLDEMIKAGRIVVVSNDRDSGRVWCQVLTEAGFTDVTSLSDALSSAGVSAIEPDLVLVDVGRLEADRLRPLDLNTDVVPVLVLHEESELDVRYQVLARGVDHCLQKPVEAAEVVLYVQNLLRMRLGHVQLRRRVAVLESQVRDQQEVGVEQDRRDRQIQHDVEWLLDDPSSPGLQCVYQPIVHLETGEVIGAEALARFPSQTERSTDCWFSEAAKVGLAPRLELAALSVALEARAQLPAAEIGRPDPFMSMNISPLVLRSPALLALVEQMHNDVPLVMELTDNEPVDDYRPFTDAIANLRHHGVRIAMDDPGAGFASLSHFVRLEPDIIKLGQDMVNGITEDRARRALVSALVHFAEESGAMLIAQRIESEDELAVLRNLGVRFGQGYHLARPSSLPLGAEELEAIAAKVIATRPLPKRLLTNAA